MLHIRINMEAYVVWYMNLMMSILLMTLIQNNFHIIPMHYFYKE